MTVRLFLIGEHPTRRSGFHSVIEDPQLGYRPAIHHTAPGLTSPLLLTSAPADVLRALAEVIRRG